MLPCIRPFQMRLAQCPPPTQCLNCHHSRSSNNQRQHSNCTAPRPRHHLSRHAYLPSPRNPTTRRNLKRTSIRVQWPSKWAAPTSSPHPVTLHVTPKSTRERRTRFAQSATRPSLARTTWNSTVGRTKTVEAHRERAMTTQRSRSRRTRLRRLGVITCSLISTNLRL